jgi:small subunit ribosomal protein S20
MPHSNSAKKRMHQNVKRAKLNRQVKSRMKTAQKIALAAFTEGVSAEDGKQLLNEAFKRIDKAAKKNIIHRNNAARKKSSLATKFNARQTPPAE